MDGTALASASKATPVPLKIEMVRASEKIRGDVVGITLLQRGIGRLAWCQRKMKLTTATHRSPWDDSHAKVLACRHHFTFLFSVDRVMLVLHRDEWRQAVVEGVF